MAKSDTEGVNKINDALQQMITDGSWKAAFDKNLGRSGYPAPQPPSIVRG